MAGKKVRQRAQVGGRAATTGTARRRYAGGGSVNFVPPSAAEALRAGEKVVDVSIDDILRLAAEDAARPGRFSPEKLARAKSFLGSGSASRVPEISVRGARAIIDDGLHRLRAAAELGAKSAPVRVPVEQAGKLRSLLTKAGGVGKSVAGGVSALLEPLFGLLQNDPAGREMLSGMGIGKLQAARGGKVSTVLGEFKRGTLHSGSKKGPKVTSRKQAVAIGLSEARKAGENVPRRRGASGGGAGAGGGSRIRYRAGYDPTGSGTGAGSTAARVGSSGALVPSQKKRIEGIKAGTSGVKNIAKKLTGFKAGGGEDIAALRKFQPLTGKARRTQNELLESGLRTDVAPLTEAARIRAQQEFGNLSDTLGERYAALGLGSSTARERAVGRERGRLAERIGATGLEAGVAAEEAAAGRRQGAVGSELGASGQRIGALGEALGGSLAQTGQELGGLEAAGGLEQGAAGLELQGELGQAGAGQALINSQMPPFEQTVIGATGGRVDLGDYLSDLLYGQQFIRDGSSRRAGSRGAGFGASPVKSSREGLENAILREQLRAIQRPRRRESNPALEAQGELLRLSRTPSSGGIAGFDQARRISELQRLVGLASGAGGSPGGFEAPDPRDILARMNFGKSSERPINIQDPTMRNFLQFGGRSPQKGAVGGRPQADQFGQLPTTPGQPRGLRQLPGQPLAPPQGLPAQPPGGFQPPTSLPGGRPRPVPGQVPLGAPLQGSSNFGGFPARAAAPAPAPAGVDPTRGGAFQPDASGFTPRPTGGTPPPAGGFTGALGGPLAGGKGVPSQGVPPQGPGQPLAPPQAPGQFQPSQPRPPQPPQPFPRRQMAAGGGIPQPDLPQEQGIQYPALVDPRRQFYDGGGEVPGVDDGQDKIPALLRAEELVVTPELARAIELADPGAPNPELILSLKDLAQKPLDYSPGEGEFVAQGGGFLDRLLRGNPEAGAQRFEQRFGFTPSEPPVSPRDAILALLEQLPRTREERERLRANAPQAMGFDELIRGYEAPTGFEPIPGEIPPDLGAVPGGPDFAPPRGDISISGWDLPGGISRPGNAGFGQITPRPGRQGSFSVMGAQPRTPDERRYESLAAAQRRRDLIQSNLATDPVGSPDKQARQLSALQAADQQVNSLVAEIDAAEGRKIAEAEVDVAGVQAQANLNDAYANQLRAVAQKQTADAATAKVLQEAAANDPAVANILNVLGETGLGKSERGSEIAEAILSQILASQGVQIQENGWFRRIFGAPRFEFAPSPGQEIPSTQPAREGATGGVASLAPEARAALMQFIGVPA